MDRVLQSCECFPSGFTDYFNNSNPSSYDCVRCSVLKCQTCTNHTLCETCVSSERLMNNSCGCPQEKFYDNYSLYEPSTYACVPCSLDICIECRLKSADYCDICLNPTRVEGNCSCPLERYFDEYYKTVQASSSTIACKLC